MNEQITSVKESASRSVGCGGKLNKTLVRKLYVGAH